MRRHALLAVGALLLPLVYAGLAHAAPPCDKVWREGCDPAATTTTTTVADDEAAAGWTCAWADRESLWWDDPATKYDDFSLVLTGDAACIDVVSGEPGRWLITLAQPPGSPTIRGVTVVPRDAVGPGDSCGGFGARHAANIYGTWTLPLLEDPRFSGIAAATVNGCGEGGFAEWIEERDDNGNAIYDETTGLPTFRYERHTTGEQHPYALQLFTQGLRSGTTVWVCVDLPPLRIDLPSDGTYPTPMECDPATWMSESS